MLMYSTPWGNEVPVKFSVSGDNISLLSFDEDFQSWMPYASVTVSVDEQAEKGCFFVKSYSENEGMAEFLIENEIAAPTGRSVRSGYVTIPEMRFDMERVREHTA